MFYKEIFMPKISIIIPVYNTEKYLTRCFDSLIKQTFSDFEIIIVNDGSVDNSELICKKYVENYPTLFKFFSQPNKGQSSARNLALQHVTGEYLTFIDSDDWMESNALELMYNDARSNDSSIVVCDFYYYNTDTPQKTDFIEEFNKNKYLPQKFVWGKLYKVAFWQENQFNFAEGIYYEDLELVPKILFMTQKISIVNLPLYNYELRNMTSTTKRFKNSEYLLTIFNRLVEFYKGKNRDILFERQLCNMLLGFFMGYSEDPIRSEAVFKHEYSFFKIRNGVNISQKMLIALISTGLPLKFLYNLLKLRNKIRDTLIK